MFLKIVTCVQLGADTWYYAKRCFLGLVDMVSKQMIVLKVTHKPKLCASRFIRLCAPWVASSVYKAKCKHLIVRGPLEQCRPNHQKV